MVAINFTCEEKKNALIEHKCQQIIRPKGKREIKVGDKLTLYWHQRYNEKCDEDICLNYECDTTFFGGCRHIDCDVCNQYKHFNNIIGYGEVTEVFDISIFHVPTASGLGVGIYNEPHREYEPVWLTQEIVNLAKQDGFETVWDFIKWFDTHYDLKEPKEFQVICFKWLEKK